MTYEGLMRIGEFARAACLSVRALRNYHENGLLVPAAVDPQTGYRSYTAPQLIDAVIIRRLRDLDVPLESIRQILDAREPAATRKILTEHGTVLRERLEALTIALADLHEAIATPVLHTPVHVREEAGTHVLAVSEQVSPEEFSAAVARAAALLVEATHDGAAVAIGPFGGAFPTQLDDDVLDVTWFLPVRTPPLLSPTLRTRGVRVAELPATRVAVLTHLGGHATLDTTYRSLGAWVAAHADSVDLPAREHYLVGPADTEDTDRFRTEICWPISRAADPLRPAK